MEIPDFMVDEKAKPHGPYEWSIWFLLNFFVVTSFLIILPFLLVIYLAMALIAFFGSVFDALRGNV